MSDNMIKIIRFSDQKLYAIFLEYGDFNTYWNKLEDILRQNYLNDLTIIIDFVIQNGLQNRFFTTFFHNGRLNEDIRFIELDKVNEQLFNNFLKSNPSIIQKSIISSSEKRQIFEYLSR